jgi:hypothetical protein
MRLTSERLELLIKRQAALADAVRAEREKRKAIAQKDRDHLTGILGRAVLANAEQSPEFKQFLIGVLRTTVTVESEQKFLKAANWL